MQKSIELRKLENMDLNSRAAINAAVDLFNNVSGKSSRYSFVVCYIPYDNLSFLSVLLLINI